MPEVVNKLPHGVRVKDENGDEHRLRAGQVKSVEGDAADRLLAVEGVEQASSEDKESWDTEYARMSGRVTDAPTIGASLEDSINNARRHVRIASVAMPLNTVIGDDDAPLGPPSGTITTKQAVARQSLVDRGAFSDHEHLPEDAESGKLSEVEQAQAEARAALEELHNEVLDEANEAGVEAATTSPESTSEQVGTTGDAQAPSSSPRRGRKAKSQDEEGQPQQG